MAYRSQTACVLITNVVPPHSCLTLSFRSKPSVPAKLTGKGSHKIMNTTGGYQWGHLRGCLPPSPRPRGGQVCRPSAFSLIQERQLTSDPWGPRPLQAQSFSWRLVSSPVPFQKSRFCFLHHQIIKDRASPVAQWLRTCLPMQETQVQSLGQEDPTCLGATKPVCHY